MVTAETATVLPVVVLLLALVLFTVRAGIDQIRCVDAARAGARSAARGDDDDLVRSLALRVAPPGSTVEVRSDAGDVVVTVHAPRVADVPVVGSLPAPVARAIGTSEGAVADVGVGG